MRSFTVLALTGIATATVLDTHQYEFLKWSQQFNKDYATFEEWTARFENWMETEKFIQEHNSSNATWTVGHNFLSDLSQVEVDKMMGYNRVLKTETPHYETLPRNAATEVDWVAAGAVTDVKNQGSCGSCWSFSTTGAMEGANFVAGNELISLSEQQFVDCDTKDSGCGGGLMDYAFTYAKTHAIELESDYAYKGYSFGGCKEDSTKGKVMVTDYTDVTPNSPEALKAAIAQQPVSVAIQANQRAFQSYNGGIITANCGTNLDHGVLAVGYGVDNGTEYFKVKNSWGSSWGEDGYVRIAVTDGAGMCGINSEPSYPTTTQASQVAATNDTLVFTQTAGQQNWLLDTSKTFCDPAYPTKGTTAKFTVAGTWFMPETIVDVEFKVMMNGTPLADLPEADAESVIPGAAWSKEFDFPVPGFAPSGTYDVTVSARDADKTHLWDVQTSFTL